MSAVDVLATIEADAIHAEAYRIAYGVIDSTPQAMADESREARAAVAELIERSNALLAGLDKTNWSSWQTTANFSAEQEALRAALARAQGGAK